jgi:hypothetical protein
MEITLINNYVMIYFVQNYAARIRFFILFFSNEGSLFSNKFTEQNYKLKVKHLFSTIKK